MFSKIIVGLDGSETSNTALRIACDLALKYSSELHLVHTSQPQAVAYALGAVAGYHAVTTMPSDEEVEAAAKKVLDGGAEIVKELGLEIAQSHSDVGDPADRIIECANSCGADLIVTGRRGLGSLGALVLGSTTQRVNHLATCACLSVA